MTLHVLPKSVDTKLCVETLCPFGQDISGFKNRCHYCLTMNLKKHELKVAEYDTDDVKLTVVEGEGTAFTSLMLKYA